MIEIFLSSFISFFVIVDPLGTAAVFSGMTTRMTSPARRQIAIKAVIIAMILLIFFGFAGEFLLRNMGISLDAFRIAGGLLLFVTAFQMIMGHHDSDSIASNEEVMQSTSNIAVYPLAIPLLAGPGCITAMILNMNANDLYGHKAIVITSVVLVHIIALICMLGAAKLTKMMGNTGATLVSRLMGILLAALAVQFIADGIMNFAEKM
jgi:multiple antibiotic resistance protein